MIQILFVQGGGRGVHDSWDNKLVESLRHELGAGYEVRYPRMPSEDDPKYAVWKPAIQAEIAKLESGSIVVGHSIGGMMLINILAESAPAIELSAIVLIATPFIGDGGWESDEISPHAQLGSLLPKDVPVLLYHGDKDETAPIIHADLYAAEVPQARVRKLANRDHQLDNNLAEIARDIRRLEKDADGA